MTDLKRHVGRIINTDRRCVVVYMQIPGRETHALIVDTDALPPRFHDDLMEIVEGEAQNTSGNLGDVLSRRLSTATGVDLLSTLHQFNFLQPQPISNIAMLPRPNQAVPLTQIIELLKGSVPQQAPQQNVSQVAPDVNPEEVRYNRITENQRVDNEEKMLGVAHGLLVEAEMLMSEATRKREQAFNMAPSLRPKTTAPVAAPQAPADPIPAADVAALESLIPAPAQSKRRGPGRPRKNAAQ